MFDLSGKVAIVTGGNGGIGLGMARGLARAGARVVVAARNAPKSKAAVEELRALGPAEAIALPVDVTDKASVDALVATTLDRCGRIDALVNNAGINIRKPADVVTLEEWRQVVDANLTSAYLCCHAVYPAMKAAGAGKIVNIGSMLSIFGGGFAPAYAASKGGIVQFTKSCASGWGKDNIQSNAVLPGWISTDLTVAARQQIPNLDENVVKRTPMGRWGVPRDFEGIAVFLCGPASDYVNGAAITVDGGYSIQV
jgi:2-deoxy-D-gluconate 3-dehydrogenase